MPLEEVTDTNYAEFLKAPKAVLVIGRDTCIDCKAYDVIINAIANEAKKKDLSFIKFGKVDTAGTKSTEGIMIENRPDVTCVPHTVLYNSGTKVASISNIRDYTYVKTQIRNYLGVEI